MESVYPAEQAMSVILNGKGVLGSDDVDVFGASPLAILDNFGRKTSSLEHGSYSTSKTSVVS